MRRGRWMGRKMARMMGRETARVMRREMARGREKGREIGREMEKERGRERGMAREREMGRVTAGLMTMMGKWHCRHCHLEHPAAHSLYVGHMLAKYLGTLVCGMMPATLQEELFRKVYPCVVHGVDAGDRLHGFESNIASDAIN
jgi:hypothetical protein